MNAPRVSMVFIALTTLTSCQTSSSDAEFLNGVGNILGSMAASQSGTSYRPTTYAAAPSPNYNSIGGSSYSPAASGGPVLVGNTPYNPPPPMHRNVVKPPNYAPSASAYTDSQYSTQSYPDEYCETAPIDGSLSECARRKLGM